MTKDTCSFEGCDRPVHARGWCITHYGRWKRHGDLELHYPTADRHWNWAGDEVSYWGVHARLNRERGTADQHVCADCGAAAKYWSFCHRDASTVLLSADGHPFSINLDDYRPRCASCHQKYDEVNVKRRP